MKKQSVQTALLVLLLLGPMLGLAGTLWRTVDYFTRFNEPVHAIWFLLKAPAFAGMLVIGFCVFRLMQAFEKLGYLTTDSINLLRVTGGSLLVIALANSACDAWQNTVILPKLATLPDFGTLLSAFMFDFFVESPAVLLLSLLVFLLAAFVDQALVVKSENEAFI
jgi:hypothetical protein